MKKIFCVEDNEDYIELIKETLKDHEVHAVKSIKEAKSFVEKQKDADCILLDLSLPDGDGLRFFSFLKENVKYQETPVVFLTHSDEIEDKISAFKLGAIDYITKPTHPLELKTRVEARLKQSENKINHSQKITVGDIKIDIGEQSVCRLDREKSETLELTTREWKLLLMLAKNKENLLSREQILEQIWPNSHVVDRTVDTHISNLRKKLGSKSLEIKSVPGMGYKLTKNV